MPEIQNGNQQLYFGKKFTVQSFSSFNGDYFYSNNFYCFERMVWLQSAETYLIEICIFPKNLKCPIQMVIYLKTKILYQNIVHQRQNLCLILVSTDL